MRNKICLIFIIFAILVAILAMVDINQDRKKDEAAVHCLAGLQEACNYREAIELLETSKELLRLNKSSYEAALVTPEPDP